MAKRRVKKDNVELVDCLKCISGSGISSNHLTDCSHPVRNPKGVKVGSWLKECSYYTERK
jgi:hypothetical protein